MAESKEISSLEEVLEAHLPDAELAEVKRILYGRQLEKLTFSPAAEELATQENFQLSGYRFEADRESTRSPRITRIGLVQNRIVKAPCEEVLDQRDALYQRMTSIIQAAALAKVNVLCFQEAWSKILFWSTAITI